MRVLRYPASKFQLVALASELPFALWTVYLSAALVDDRRAVFLLMLLAGFAVPTMRGLNFLTTSKPYPSRRAHPLAAAAPVSDESLNLHLFT